MKIKKYFSLYFSQFNLIGRIFTYPKVDTDVLSGEYDAYWEKRTTDKERYHFSLNMKWWEKILSLRYQKSAITADIIEDGSTVLDIGCGDGLVLKFIAALKKIEGIGIDLSQVAIDKLKEAGFSGYVADITDPERLKALPATDYILLLDIIEHLQYPERLLLALKDKCKKGIIINIPNTGHYATRLRMLFGRTPAQFLYFPGEHIRFWSIRDFFWWCNLLGYTIVKHQSAFGTWVLRGLWPSMFSSSQVFVIKKQ